MPTFSDNYAKHLRTLLDEAEVVLVGAGAGLSTISVTINSIRDLPFPSFCIV